MSESASSPRLEPEPSPKLSAEVAQTWLDALQDAVIMVLAGRERELSFEVLYASATA